MAIDTKLEKLQSIGFMMAGSWRLEPGDEIQFELSSHENKSNILYAFVVDGKLKYIGKTVKMLAKRMGQYKNPHDSQRTNSHNHANIRTCLAEGHSVDIYALPDNGLLHFGDFHINLAAGLEDDLIKQLDPEWNGGLKETEKEMLELPVNG